VHQRESGALLADISTPGQRFIAARGGRGGLGNDRFKSPTNQAPRQSTPGEEGDELALRLELKLIADVGLIGLPNAGKSTLLRAVSRATPKVADYPFTTLSPNLGLALLPGVGRGDERRLVLADIPGLIEGAAQGAGLGHDFLKHIERTSVLVHVLEVRPADGSDPAANYRAIRAELGGYSSALLEKAEVVALNKIDLVPEDERAKLVRGLAKALKCPRDSGLPIVISGATGEGTRALLEACWTALDRSAPPAWTGAAMCR